MHKKSSDYADLCELFQSTPPHHVRRPGFNDIIMFIHADLFRIQFQNSKTCHCSCAKVIKAEGTLKCQSAKKQMQQVLVDFKKKLWTLIYHCFNK